MTDLSAVLTLQAGYNSAVVVAGAGALGAAAGTVGVFSFLRRRALISDAVSHGTLPGVALAFLLGVALFGDGRAPALLTAGAAVTGAAAVLCVQLIRDGTRLTEDAAIGTVLSVFFAVGIVLLSHIQTLQTSGQAGLETYLLGATATLTRGEAEMIAGVALAVIAAQALLFKEFGLVAFDADFARSLGLNVTALDLAVMGLLLAVVSIGLKTVGLVLIIALVIIPPAAARFWTDRLGVMAAVAAAIGAGSGWIGASLSAVAPDLPAGGLIVLTCGALFAVGLVFAPKRGALATLLRRLEWRYRVLERQGLLCISAGQPILHRPTRRVLRLTGVLDRAGRTTAAGRARAAAARREDRLWRAFLDEVPEAALRVPRWGIGRIADRLPADTVAHLEAKVAAETAAGQSGP